MKRSPAVTSAWMIVFFLCVGGLTVAAYVSLVIPDYRNFSFYVAVVSSCVAEFAFFAMLLYVALPGEAAPASAATRRRIAVPVFLWMLAVLIGSAVSVIPSVADTFYADKLLLFILAATLLMFIGVFFLQRQDVVIAESRAEMDAGRVRIQTFSAGILPLMEKVRRLIGHGGIDESALETLAKRLDVLRSQLLSVSPQPAREEGRPVAPVSDEEIEVRLRSVHQSIDQLTSASAEVAGERVDACRAAVDEVIAALRHREDALTF